MSEKSVVEYASIKKALNEDGRFNCECMLGEGVYGSVVKAKLKKDSRDYAIKFMPLFKRKDTFSTQDVDRRVKYQERELNLLREMKCSANRNVVRYFGSCEMKVDTVDYLCIQMELCSMSLLYLICGIGKTFSRDSQFYQHVFPQVLNGLDAVHSHGWIHRDIHPGNILCTEISADGSQFNKVKIKIADFGLARNIGIHCQWGPVLADAPMLQLSTLEQGDPYAEYFRAPELWTEAYDFKVDMYSAGMVLYFISRYLENQSEWDSEFRALRKGELDIENKLECHHKHDKKLCSLLKLLLKKDPKERLTAYQAMYYQPSSAKSPQTAQRFFAWKSGEEETDVTRCYLKELTLSGLKEAVESGLGIKVGSAKQLRQVRMINNVKKHVKVKCDKDVEDMFRGEAAANLEHDVEIFVEEVSPGADNDIVMGVAQQENDGGSSESL